MSDKWSTRTAIYCRANLDAAASYRLREAKVHAIPNGQIGDMRSYVLDIEHSAEGIEDAFVRGLDLADQFMDVVSLASVSGVSRIAAVVTRTPLITTDSPGELAVPHSHMRVSAVDVNPGDVEAYSEVAPVGSPRAIALRHVRDALSARNSTDAQWNFWMAIESIAADESTTNMIRRCGQCGEEQHGERETMPLIRSFFREFGSSGAEAKKQRSARSKTAHGAGLRDTANQDKLAQRVAAIEPVAIQLLSTRTGIVPATNMGLVVGSPISVYEIWREDDEQLKIRPKVWESGAAMPRIPKERTFGRDRTVELGLSLQIDEASAQLAGTDSAWAV